MPRSHLNWMHLGKSPVPPQPEVNQSVLPHSPSVFVGRGYPWGSPALRDPHPLPWKGRSLHLRWPLTMTGHQDHPRSFAEDRVASPPLGSPYWSCLGLLFQKLRFHGKKLTEN